jgi:hypothetical protein
LADEFRWVTHTLDLLQAAATSWHSADMSENEPYTKCRRSRSPLSRDDWQAIRADWTAGTFSNRALAARAGVSEKAIRLRASNPHQEGGPWQRSTSAPPSGPGRITRRHLSRFLKEEAELQALAIARHEAEVQRQVLAQRAALSERREILIKQGTDPWVRENLEHLRRLESAQKVTDHIYRHLMSAMATPSSGDEKAIRDSIRSRAILFRAPRDSLSRYVLGHAQALESIRQQLDRILGLDKEEASGTTR